MNKEDILFLIDEEIEEYTHYDFASTPSKEKKAKKKAMKDLRKKVRNYEQ